MWVLLTRSGWSWPDSSPNAGNAQQFTANQPSIHPDLTAWWQSFSHLAQLNLPWNAVPIQNGCLSVTSWAERKVSPKSPPLVRSLWWILSSFSLFLSSFRSFFCWLLLWSMHAFLVWLNRVRSWSKIFACCFNQRWILFELCPHTALGTLLDHSVYMLPFFGWIAWLWWWWRWRIWK